MPNTTNYCHIVNDTVELMYHVEKVPILNAGIRNGKKIIDECSHDKLCQKSTINCPVFKELNNI